MNSSQKLGMFILILITVLYVYITFFNKEIKFPEFNLNKNTETEYSPLETITDTSEEMSGNSSELVKSSKKTVPIYIVNKSGKIRSVNRECDTSIQKSCFEFAINQLVSAPSKWEKSKGFTSEIPQNTKVLSVRESSGSIMIDLSSEFETGGGAESSYYRIMQLIKTANANTTLPVYLYINGKQVNVIGGEGIMIKQPLTERSLDE